MLIFSECSVTVCIVFKWRVALWVGGLVGWLVVRNRVCIRWSMANYYISLHVALSIFCVIRFCFEHNEL